MIGMTFDSLMQLRREFLPSLCFFYFLLRKKKSMENEMHIVTMKSYLNGELQFRKAMKSEP